MRRIALLPLLLLAVGLPFVETLVAQDKPLPKAEVKRGRKIAVLVGVNGYQDAKFPNLEFAEADMLSLKEKLEKSGFEVILLLGSSKGDAEASRANIAAVLLDKREENKRFAFREITDAEDQILVAFSGHGEQIIVEEDDDGKKSKREVPHFCPKRAETGKPSTQVSLNEVLRTFNGGKAKALLLVDACRSFAENRDATKGAVIDRNRADSLRPNVGGMFAASDRQAAREKGGHGLFFHAVLEVMEQENCKDKDGNVVWSRMTDEISDAVKKRSKELFPALKDDEHQVPDPFGRFRDKFVLATAGVATKERKGGEEVEFEIADGVKMRFCWIPPGEAQLGSPKAERDAVLKQLVELKDAKEGEEPKWLKAEAEEVRGKYKEKTGFWLGKYPVTQQEWGKRHGSWW